MRILKLENIHKNNTTDNAGPLSNISFDVKEGEILVLAGEKDSGIATLIRIISGLDSRYSGKMLLFDKNHHPLKMGGLKTGVILPDLALFPNLNLLENVKFASQGNKEAVDKKAKACMEIIGLKDNIDKYPGEVQTEDQFRAALARAIASEPSLLLLCHPFHGLKSMKKNQLVAKTREIVKRVGITTILATSDKAVALSISDRMAVFHKGHLQQIDSPQNIYQHPVNAYVANFFGKRNEVLATPTHDGFYTSFGFIDDERSKTFNNKVKILFRPEEIKVKKSVRQALTGTVKQCLFFGDHQMITLEGDMEKSILVKSGPNRSYTIGTNVFFTLRTFKIEEAF